MTRKNQLHAVRTGFYSDKLVGTSILSSGDFYMWQDAQCVIIIFASVDMEINRMTMKRMAEFSQRQGWRLKDEQ